MVLVLIVLFIVPQLTYLVRNVYSERSNFGVVTGRRFDRSPPHVVRQDSGLLVADGYPVGNQRRDDGRDG